MVERRDSLRDGLLGVGVGKRWPGIEGLPFFFCHDIRIGWIAKCKIR